ncbi:MAG: glutamyl-tRNA reductase [Deltaproteobacteria bacterium]|nr:glutamyl-tRNA reductase [Deltaproteobacteria bacterium]
MKILLAGMNHRTAPIEVRERFVVDETGPWLAKLVAGEEIEEAVLLSTCNRVEVIVTTRRLEAARHRLRSFFLRDLGRGEPLPEHLSSHAVLYEHVDTDAVRHLLRVAASIDSLVVGEPQILGQVKDAYRVAAECGASGPVLSRLFAAAFAAAKRVRSETRIAERPVSVARIAVDLASQIFETLADKRALLVGAGDMIEMALEALRGAGLAGIAVANRTPAHAAELAGRFGASAHGLDELPALVAGADVVLTCFAADRPLLDVPLFEEALRVRRRRPIFVIDIGVPRNVDAGVNDLDDVYLYDLDDLGGVAEANAEERRRETVRAEGIVQEEVDRFGGWLTALAAVPTIRRLRGRAEAVREAELARWVARAAPDEEARRAVEALTRAIVNKVLHAPVSRLRAQAEREEGLAYLQAARVLFALDDPSAPGAEADLDDGPPPDPGDEPGPGRA